MHWVVKISERLAHKKVLLVPKDQTAEGFLGAAKDGSVMQLSQLEACVW